MLKLRWSVLITIILAAAATRVLPHPPNVTPLTAIALFGGVHFSDKRLAFVAPFAALILSDLVLGFYPQMEYVYFCFAMIVCIGFWLQTKPSFHSIAAAILASSVLFFVVTNFAVWFFQSLYPKTLEGLLTCYLAAIPFFQNSVLGDFFYTTLLFGGFALLEKGFPQLRDPRMTAAAIAI